VYFSFFQHIKKRKPALEGCFSSFQKQVLAQWASFYICKHVFHSSSAGEKENQGWKDVFHSSTTLEKNTTAEGCANPANWGFWSI
jgi:hypothetical protein